MAKREDSDKVLNKIEHYDDFDGWSAPFTYAFYDTRLVRRTNWLLADMGEDPYGRKFNYSEHLLFPTEESAKEVAWSSPAPRRRRRSSSPRGGCTNSATASTTRLA